MKRILAAIILAVLIISLTATSAFAAYEIEKKQNRIVVTMMDGILTGPGSVPVSVCVDNDDRGWYRLRNIVVYLPDGQFIRKDTVAGWQSYFTGIRSMNVSDSMFHEKSFTVTVSYDLHQNHNDVFLEHRTESVTLKFQTAPNQLIKSVMEFFGTAFFGLGKFFIVLLFIWAALAALGGGGDFIEIIFG